MVGTGTENYTLRPFQQVIADTFYNPQKGLDVRSVLIADDMGLGKTVEAIDLDYKRRQATTNITAHRKTLILAPMSVVGIWVDHYAWMLPHLRVVYLEPKDRPSFLKAVREDVADVYVMHWNALRLMPELIDFKWFHIIGDEIQYVKNRKAKVTLTLKQLRTFYKTGLSGTPADNAPQDLWSVLHWLYPRDFRSYWRFYKQYVDFEQDFNGYYKVSGVKNVESLHKEMAPFYIRRRKTEVAKDLPEKYFSTLWVDLSPSQRKQYNDMRKGMLAWIGEQDQSKPLPAPSALTKLVRLQQFALASVDSKIVQQWQMNKNFDSSQPEVPYDREQRLDRHNWRRRIVHVTKYFLIDPSSKIDAAMHLLETSDPDEPIVFFTQFKTMVNLFGQRLASAGINHCLLTGVVSQSDRNRMVRDFQAGKIRVFAGTIKAGGVGITLTRSSHVAFFDRTWSPTWNIQAEDRLHRIGQKNAVQVTDIIAKNTIDAGRTQRIQDKWIHLQQILGDKTLDYQKGVLKTDNSFSFLNGVIKEIG